MRFGSHLFVGIFCSPFLSSLFTSSAIGQFFNIKKSIKFTFCAFVLFSVAFNYLTIYILRAQLVCGKHGKKIVEIYCFMYFSGDFNAHRLASYPQALTVLVLPGIYCFTGLREVNNTDFWALWYFICYYCFICSVFVFTDLVNTKCEWRDRLFHVNTFTSQYVYLIFLL